MNRHPSVIAGLLALGLATVPAPGTAIAQGAPPPSPARSPAETSPMPTTTAPDPETRPGGGSAAPMPEKSLAPVPAQPGAPPSGSSAAPARQTLVPTPGDLNDVDAVTLPAKPAAILSGRTKWEEAVPSLKAAFKRIEEDLAKAGIRPTGRPISVFTKTEDDGFQYEAMIPVEAVPETKPTPSDGLRFGTTPSGKALRFKHLGTYDEIDGTYETLTAYLDAKDVSVQDRFIEEYVTDLDDRADAKLDVNIYAMPR